MFSVVIQPILALCSVKKAATIAGLIITLTTIDEHADNSNLQNLAPLPYDSSTQKSDLEALQRAEAIQLDECEAMLLMPEQQKETVWKFGLFNIPGAEAASPVLRNTSIYGYIQAIEDVQKLLINKDERLSVRCQAMHGDHILSSSKRGVDLPEVHPQNMTAQDCINLYISFATRAYISTTFLAPKGVQQFRNTSNTTQEMILTPNNTAFMFEGEQENFVANKFLEKSPVAGTSMIVNNQNGNHTYKIGTLPDDTRYAVMLNRNLTNITTIDTMPGNATECTSPDSDEEPNFQNGYGMGKVIANTNVTEFEESALVQGYTIGQGSGIEYVVRALFRDNEEWKVFTKPNSDRLRFTNDYTSSSIYGPIQLILGHMVCKLLEFICLANVKTKTHSDQQAISRCIGSYHPDIYDISKPENIICSNSTNRSHTFPCWADL